MSPRGHILVVDDNADLGENLIEILEDAGYRAQLFTDPLEALGKVCPGQYALALLDLRMPGLDGVELFRALRRRDPTLLAVAMTAFAHDDRVREAVDEGMLVVFTKPVEPSGLLGRLEGILATGA
ncbi:MAG: response regulator [Deltaproteobacteria bacterium]|nr:response regulator [Deltaproteobacteria bacterium]